MYQHLHRRFRDAPHGNVTIDSRKPRTNHGFTIVELLVVIVVIAILAAITIVSYTGISSKATVASLTSDLDNASKQLKMYYVEYGAYPASLDGSNCPTGPTDTKYCLKPSPGTTYAYSSIVPSTFHLTGTKSSTGYSVTDNSPPAVATTAASCPSGFIPVPGSGTYGTNDFCTMKYEAKNVAGVATSQAALTPWVSITQTSAITTSAAACAGCHLITEGEWLTIAQNVLNVPGNWDNGVGGHTVGTGYIYSGNNDGTPGIVDADTNDSNGYYNTSNVAPSNQRRTLTLSNGQVIWDLAGNVDEWTSGTTQSPIVQPGISGGGGDWREWTAITNPGTLSPSASPSTTGISGAGSWNSGNGIGAIWSNADDGALHSTIRGGAWNYGYFGGVLMLSLGSAPGYTDARTGFRVSR